MHSRIATPNPSMLEVRQHVHAIKGKLDPTRCTRSRTSAGELVVIKNK
jgi:hypothetical protein